MFSLVWENKKKPIYPKISRLKRGDKKEEPETYPNENKKRVVQVFYDAKNRYLEKRGYRLTTQGSRLLEIIYKRHQNNIISRLHKGNNIEKLALELVEKVMQSDCMRDNLIDEVSNEPSAQN